jgi:hypothetical protein
MIQRKRRKCVLGQFLRKATEWTVHGFMRGASTIASTSQNRQE